MKNTIIILLAVGAFAYWYKTKKSAPATKELGAGWKLNKDGTATGPNGEQAMQTGYMTGDPYPAQGQYAI